MSGTLCETCIKPVYEDGQGEPEILTIWPMSECDICKRPPGDYHTLPYRMHAVRDSTIIRAFKAQRAEGFATDRADLVKRLRTTVTFLKETHPCYQRMMSTINEAADELGK